MAIGLGTLLRVAKNGVTPDEIGVIFEAMGADVDFTPLAHDAVSQHAEEVARAGEGLYNKSLRLNVRMKNGETMTAVMVWTPAQKFPAKVA